jgi:hypothetical protein
MSPMAIVRGSILLFLLSRGFQGFVARGLRFRKTPMG